MNQDKVIKIVSGLIDKLPLEVKDKIKAPGTGRGVMIIVGLIILALLHPEEAKKFIELIALALIYGTSNIIRKK